MELRICNLILVLGVAFVDGQATYCPLTGQDVVRLRASSIDQLQQLKQLVTNYPNLHIKPWVQPNGAGTPGLYMMPSDVAEYLVAQAKLWGMDAAILHRDVQRSFLDRPDPMKYPEPYKYAYPDPTKNRTIFTRGSGPESYKLNEFHPLDEINLYMEALKARFSKLCDVESIGRSFNGKEMFMLKIGTNPNSTRGIFLDATMHAREWLATSTSLYIATQLLTNYYKKDDIRALVDSITWYIVPVVNVDGYEYTWQQDRNWRRSRSSPDPCNGEECRCRGVDLNRNFDSHWNTTDACFHACCNTYPGTKPLSEPETSNIAKKVKSLENRVQAYITLHTYGQLWMFPYGYEKGAYTKDVADLYEVAKLAVEAVKKVHGTQYKYGSVADTLYEYSGGSQDWVRDHTRIKYSYLIELRPPGFDGQYSGHFCVDTSHIVPTGQEIFEGIKVVAKAVLGEIKPSGKAWKNKDKEKEADDGARINGLDMKILIAGSILLVIQKWLMK